MRLEGSCHCGAVRFSVDSHTPYPYMRCYCGACRKTQGGGGFAINIMAEAATLEVKGRRTLRVYRAPADRVDGGGQGGLSYLRRHFCGRCGSALWCADPRWPQWLYPFASAIDTPLPKPKETCHIMLDHAAPWVEVPRGRSRVHFDGYPDEAIVDWHKHRGLLAP